MWHCLCVRQPWHVAAGRASGGAGGPPRVGLAATLAVRAEPVLRGSLAAADGFRQLSGHAGPPPVAVRRRRPAQHGSLCQGPPPVPPNAEAAAGLGVAALPSPLPAALPAALRVRRRALWGVERAEVNAAASS